MCSGVYYKYIGEIMKKRRIIQLILLAVFIFLPIFFIRILPNYLAISDPTDADKIYEGPYTGYHLITEGRGAIQIMNLNTRQILWETEEPEFFVHDADILPGGNTIVVADTNADRVFVMNLSNKAILWEWYARNNTHNEFVPYNNWTQFGLENGWDTDAIAHTENFDQVFGPMMWYSHLNSVEYINGTMFGRSYDSILISLRNFDMIIEVNFTAKEGEPGYKNITWHYGEPLKHDILNHQHATIRLPNGHTAICDSDNYRVIEINETNQVVWEYKNNKLRWVRDVELLPNNNYLIADSVNNRIIEVNRTTKQIVRTFTDLRLNIPFDAEYIPEDNQLLVSSHPGQVLLIFNYDNTKVIDCLGILWIFAPFFIILLIVIAYLSVDCVYQFKKMKEKSIKDRFLSLSIYSKLILIGLAILAILWFNYIFSFILYNVIM
jgi:hypothetical protein